LLLKNLEFDFKAKTDKREFEGYASTWDKDLGGDQILQGAFKKTIQERFHMHPKKSGIKILWQHSDPLGKPIHMEEDSKGLYVKGYVSKTRLGDEALELMQDGVIDQMSIGYDVVKDDLSEDGQTRYLKELILFEFSPVTFPMNPLADITSVKTHFNSLIKEFGNPIMATMLKEGRTLNKTNVQALKSAVETLQGILAQVEGKEEPKNLHSLDPFKELIAEMKNYKI